MYKLCGKTTVDRPRHWWVDNMEFSARDLRLEEGGREGPQIG